MKSHEDGAPSAKLTSGCWRSTCGTGNACSSRRSPRARRRRRSSAATTATLGLERAVVLRTALDVLRVVRVHRQRLELQGLQALVEARVAARHRREQLLAARQIGVRPGRVRYSVHEMFLSVPSDSIRPPSEPSKNCSGFPGTVISACWSGWSPCGCVVDVASSVRSVNVLPPSCESRTARPFETVPGVCEAVLAEVRRLGVDERAEHVDHVRLSGRAVDALVVPALAGAEVERRVAGVGRARARLVARTSGCRSRRRPRPRSGCRRRRRRCHPRSGTCACCRSRRGREVELAAVGVRARERRRGSSSRSPRCRSSARRPVCTTVA